ncbi:MAG TPA: hypothetical protein VFS33_02495 [Gemmatimonadales bacterium]|nr:hypothetical protein [Gemmatimonadales bacterium]
MRHELRLAVGSEQLRAEIVRRGRIVWSAVAEHHGPMDLPEVMTQLAAEPVPVRVGRVHVEFERPVVQVRTLTGLPPVRRHALEALVALQAARFFRRTGGGPLVTCAAWAPAPKGQPTRREARAAAVEQPWLDAVASGARGMGVRLGRIAPADPATAGLRFELQSDRTGRQQALVRRLWASIALAATVWGAVGVFTWHRTTRELRRVDAELRALQGPLAAVQRARHEVDRVHAMSAALAADRLERGAVLHQLAAVTAALPDSAFLTSATLRRDDGVVSGLARRAVSVVAAFERSPVALAPRLDGAISPEPMAGQAWERFTVKLGTGAAR